MQLGELANMSPESISHFECGRRVPTIKNLCKLADGLSVTTDYLGPLTQQLNYHLKTMSHDNIVTIVEFAQLLRNKK